MQFWQLKAQTNMTLALTISDPHHLRPSRLKQGLRRLAEGMWYYTLRTTEKGQKTDLTTVM